MTDVFVKIADGTVKFGVYGGKDVTPPVISGVIIEGISAYLMVIRAREMLKYAIISEDNVKQITGMQEALVRRGKATRREQAGGIYYAG